MVRSSVATSGGGGVEFHQPEDHRSTPVHQFPPPPPPDDSVHQFPPPPPPDDNVHQFPPPPPPKDNVHQFPPPPPPKDNVHQFPPPPPPKDNVHQFPPPRPEDNVHQMPFTPPLPHPPPPQPAAAIPMGLQPWKTDLFDCMKNPQNALITCFFPCVTFGQIAEIMDGGSTSCATSGMLYTLIECFIAMPCAMSCSYRTKLRSKFGLIESPASDFLIHCFCEYCALCQEYRELEERGIDPSIGWLGNVAKQQQLIGMTPPVQQRMV